MSIDAAAAAPPPAAVVAGRLGDESLRLVAAQLVRVFVSLLVVDAFLVWLLSRVGLLWPALGWAAFQVAMQGVRYAVVARHREGAASAAVTLRRLLPVYAAMGIGRAAILPLLFALPAVDTHYIFTMVLVGQLAGAVGSVGGMVRAYLVWAVPLTLAGAIAWLAQGTFEGRWIAALMILMLQVLTSYVSANAQTLSQLVRSALEKDDLASSLRRERDLVQQTSDANRVLADSLAVARDRAEAASESKTRFFAAASHDLRQPLHALSINATTLQVVAGRQSDPLIKELSQSINRSLQQSNGLLESLLDISRLDAGAVQLSLEPVDIVVLLNNVAADFAAAAGQRGIALVVESTAEAKAAELLALTDFDTLLRIVNNLVSNAIKFTSEGSVRLSAGRTTAAARDIAGDTIFIRVSDSGCGIAVEEQERVFEEFYQVGNPSRDRDQGLGLGLSIVRRSAALLGAGLSLHSEPGRGTQVELRLPSGGPKPAPLGAGALPDAPALESAPSVLNVSGTINLAGAGVLVIDDEPEITRSLTRLLPLWNCECRVAASLAEALAVLDGGFDPQALVVDHRLRGETGPQAITAIRERLPGVVAILVTGDTSPANLQAMAESGCRVVHKPIDGTRLAEALSAALAEATDARCA